MTSYYFANKVHYLMEGCEMYVPCIVYGLHVMCDFSVHILFPIKQLHSWARTQLANFKMLASYFDLPFPPNYLAICHTILGASEAAERFLLTCHAKLCTVCDSLRPEETHILIAGSQLLDHPFDL